MSSKSDASNCVCRWETSRFSIFPIFYHTTNMNSTYVLGVKSWILMFWNSTKRMILRCWTKQKTMFLICWIKQKQWFINVKGTSKPWSTYLLGVKSWILMFWNPKKADSHMLETQKQWFIHFKIDQNLDPHICWESTHGFAYVVIQKTLILICWKNKNNDFYILK